MNIKTIQKRVRRAKGQFAEFYKITSSFNEYFGDFKQPISLEDLSKINVQQLISDAFAIKDSYSLTGSLLERLYEATPMVDDSIDFI